MHRVLPMRVRAVGRELLAFFGGDASRWTQGSTAKDELSQPVPARHHSAECWCLEGAVLRCGIDDGVYALFQVLGTAVTTWNDAPERSFRDVQTLLKSMADGCHG